MRIIAFRSPLCALALSILLGGLWVAPAQGAGRRAHGGATAHRSAKKHRHKGPAERDVEGSLSYELTPENSTIPATQTITLLLPAGVHSAGAAMAKCNPQALEKEGPKACPKASRVGSGSALGWTLGQPWPVNLELFNGPGGALLSYTTASSPVKIETIVNGTVTRPSGSTYGEQLAFTIPSELLEPLPNDTAQLVRLSSRITAKSGWLRDSNCAPHPQSVNFKFGYTNGQTVSVGGTFRCV